jgi:hypothetical protein
MFQWNGVKPERLPLTGCSVSWKYTTLCQVGLWKLLASRTASVLTQTKWKNFKTLSLRDTDLDKGVKYWWNQSDYGQTAIKIDCSQRSQVRWVRYIHWTRNFGNISVGCLRSSICICFPKVSVQESLFNWWSTEICTERQSEWLGEETGITESRAGLRKAHRMFRGASSSSSFI